MGVERLRLAGEDHGVLVHAARPGDLGQADEGVGVRPVLADGGDPLVGGRLEEAAAQVDAGEQLAAIARGAAGVLDGRQHRGDRVELLDAQQRLKGDDERRDGVGGRQRGRLAGGDARQDS